jgi:glycosyltransferase involved in cell wall biosynthesis
MRVLAVTNLFPNPWQPNRAPFNRQQFGALARRHQVCVIAPIPWTDEFSLRRRRAAPALLPDRRVTCGGLDVIHPRYLFPPRILRGFYGHLFRHCIHDHFHRALVQFKPDIVLAAWAYPDGWAAAQLAREVGLPVAIKVHGSDILLLKDGSVRARRTVEALQRADAVVTVSQHLGRRIAQLGVRQDKISVVYNGVNAGLFSPADRAEAKRRLGFQPNLPLVLYVGNLLPVKGPDVLINACAHLDRSGVSFRCRLIGQGAMRADLERQIHALRLADRIKLLGPRPLEDLPDWYRAANVLAIPSRSEGIPNVALEAMACGTPVVATDVGGIPEIVPSQSLVPPDNPQALADALHNFASNTAPPTQFTPMTWDQSAADLAAVLERTVQTSSIALKRAA